VPPEILKSKGAVSSEVAIALADGIRRRVGSTLGVGITAWRARAAEARKNPSARCTSRFLHAGGVKERGVRFPGDREAIRWHAAQLALDMVRIHFLYNGGEAPAHTRKGV